MRGGIGSRGYTVIETMIFLAITGFTFMIAASFISGRQSKAQFNEGVNDINAQVQQIIGDVGNGFYPSSKDYSCKATGSLAPTFGPPVPPSGSTPGSAPGNNLGCVTLGKVIQFGNDSPSGGSPDPVNFAVYSVAGRQFKDNVAQTLPLTLQDAQPQVIATPDANITSYGNLTWGVKVTSMKNSATNTDIDAVGILTSFSNNAASGLESGSQTISLLPIAGAHNLTGGVPSESRSYMADDIKTYLNNPSTTLTSAPVLICMSDGGSQFASLRIGSNASGTVLGSRLTTSVQISNSAAELGC